MKKVEDSIDFLFFLDLNLTQVIQNGPYPSTWDGIENHDVVNWQQRILEIHVLIWIKKLSIAFLSDKRKTINYSLVFFETGFA